MITTVTEAYNQICEVYKERPVVSSCWEYKDFFGFYLLPPGSEIQEQNLVGFMILVMKRSGRVMSEDDRPDINVRRLDRRKIIFRES